MLYQLLLFLIVLFLLKKYLNGGTNQHSQDLRGKTILITGANTGIGLETAKVLSKMGAHILLACRNVKAALEAKEKIKHYSQNDLITIVELDLSSKKSIEECVKKVKELSVAVDILINNAGVMMCPYMTTKEGFELQVGTNHIGHFYLTTMLLDEKILNDKEGRIINVSSKAHEGGLDFDPENMFMNEGNYSKVKAYAHSKIANVLFTIELQRRLDEKKSGIMTCSLHPGAVATELLRHVYGSHVILKTLETLLYPLVLFLFKSPLQGAQTTLHCALGPIEKGAYYADCQVLKARLPKNYEEVAKNLWIKSEFQTEYVCKSLKD